MENKKEFSEQFRALRADEVEVRLARLNRKNKDDATAGVYLLYKDARCDMRILDETFGPFNWQRDHKQVKNSVYCGVSILTPVEKGYQGEWITKWDAGDETDVEAVKGEASDSFKRACFNWGIGRELYTAPKIEIQFDGEWEKTNKCHYGLRVSEMVVSDHKITKLVISDSKRVRFTWEADKLLKIKSLIDQCNTTAELTQLWNEYPEYQNDDSVRSYFSERKRNITA